MSTTTSSNDDWEYSKENIQPLQQGRKPEVLKHASCEHPEDEIQQQRQAFENELRTYSGDDPLSVWCRYINWVEQNFLKGGRDGHIEQLIRKCVTILKDETKYYDDKRFIAIWLKFANSSIKPIEVFNYMYSHSIGCRSAIFFITWSWKLEQQGNIKNANQVLREGINVKAEPFESLKSYFSEFEIRVARKIMESEQAVDSDCQRSAFTILKPQRNSIPVERIGESTMGCSKASMLIGGQQPVPKSVASSSKVPFKIYNADKPTPSLPVQTKGPIPFAFHSDSSKENDIKPSKWNKVKLKQVVPASRPVSSSEIGFNFHCDEAPQPACTPRSVPKVSNVLRSRQGTKSPAMALFEPPDPMKQPMYDKNKVYCGAEEFSLEEIKAAAWLKTQHLLRFEKSMDEPESQTASCSRFSQKRETNFNIHSEQITDAAAAALKSFPCNESRKVSTALILLQEGENPPRALFSPINYMKHPIYDRNKVYGGKEELSLEELKAIAWLEKSNKQQKELEKLQNEVKNLTKQLEYMKKSESIQLKEENESQLKNNIVKHEPYVQLYSCIQRTLENEHQNGSTEHNLISDKAIVEHSNEEINSQPCATNNNNGSEHGKAIPDLLGLDYLKVEHSNKNVASNQTYLDIKNENEYQKTKELIPKLLNSSLEQRSKIYENLSGEYYMGGAPGVTEILQGKQFSSASFCEAHDMLQQLYNGTFANLPNAVLANEIFRNKDNTGSLKDIIYNDSNEISSNKSGLPFTLYQDPTESATLPKYVFQDSHHNKVGSQVKSDLPFTLYQDPTEVTALPNGIYSSESAQHEMAANDENVSQTNEDLENIPPKGFVQNTTKRELSGILTPAINVPYVPLEAQELQEECSDSDEICSAGNEALLPNETLFPLCNTEQFFSAQFSSSTPCASFKNGKRPHLQVSTATDTYNYGLELCSANAENFDMGTPQGIVDSTINKQALKSEKNTYTKPCNLSVIIETSKESYKSSASSGSSASVTKFSQFEQYYSYDKSNMTHKESSKTDTFKEPKPIDIDCNFSSMKKAIEDISQSQEQDKKQKIFDLHDFNDDPFSSNLNKELLQSLDKPPHHHTILENCKKNFRFLKVNDTIEIKETSYLIENLIAEGAFGKVFMVERQISSQGDFDSDPFCSKFALKVCKHGNEWELYICSTLHKRLQEIKDTLDVQKSVMNIIAAKQCNDGMIMISEFCQRGTLLDLVNFHKKQNSSVPQYLTMYITLELLQTMQEIHKCKIIHADIKPDNVLMRDFSLNLNFHDCLEQNISFLKIIDFGCSIDLSFFKEGICFTTPLKMQCFEVLENKPWVFQPDWCGILNCVHTLLFSEYMKVRRKEDGKWGIEKKIPRYYATEIWTPLFDELLNIPACYQEPNIAQHVNRIKAKLPLNSNLLGLRNFFKK